MLVVFISTNMASTLGTVPPPPEVAVTVTVLGAGTNLSGLNLTATTMLPSAKQAPGPSLTSEYSLVRFIFEVSFASFTLWITIMVMLWKIYSYKLVKEHVPKPKQKASRTPTGLMEQGEAGLTEGLFAKHLGR